MSSIKGITVCVEFDDLLAITLPRNAALLSEVVVVTTHDDHRTHTIVDAVPNARCYKTDAFYRHGATFNKGLALEEGFDELGRDGWMLIWDADILFPASMPTDGYEIGNLYTPRRRILQDPRRWSPRFSWQRVPVSDEPMFAGYFQLFHADDQCLADRPWYGVDYIHAGGGDREFQNRWPVERKIRPSFRVLHLGPRDANWFGRIGRRIDGQPIENRESRRHLMETLLRHKGWGRPKNIAHFDERIKGN